MSDKISVISDVERCYSDDNDEFQMDPCDENYSPPADDTIRTPEELLKKIIGELAEMKSEMFSFDNDAQKEYDNINKELSSENPDLVVIYKSLTSIIKIFKIYDRLGIMAFVEYSDKIDKFLENISKLLFIERQFL